MKLQRSLLMFALCLTLSACGGQSGTRQSSETTELDSVEINGQSEALTSLGRQLLASDNQYSVLYIKHHKVECESYQVSLCYLVRQSPTEQWTLFYDEIDGFDYHWGYDYQIRVQLLTAADTPLLNYNASYQLIDILDRSDYQAGAEFDLAIRAGHVGLTKLDDTGFALHGDTELQCQFDQCNTLRSLDLQGHTLVLHMQHSAPDMPMVLSYIACSDSPASFGGSCGWPSYSN